MPCISVYMHTHTHARARIRLYHAALCELSALWWGSCVSHSPSHLSPVRSLLVRAEHYWTQESCGLGVCLNRCPTQMHTNTPTTRRTVLSKHVQDSFIPTPQPRALRAYAPSSLYLHTAHQGNRFYVSHFVPSPHTVSMFKRVLPYTGLKTRPHRHLRRSSRSA